MIAKKVIAIVLTVFMLSCLFALPAYADTEINKCDKTDGICNELQSIYGFDSAVLFSTTKSEACTQELTLEIDGTMYVVFVSELKEQNTPEPPAVENTPQDEIPTINGIEDIGSQLPNTTTDDILNWATTKGNEIIYMLQIFSQPFAIIIFIVAAFMTLIGCIGKSDMVGKGVWGMIMGVVVYAAVLYAPVILQSFVGWVAS